MKEIKAFLHRNRVPDVVHALRQAGLHAPRAHLSVIDVRGTLAALDARERGYSVEAGEPMIAEVKLELICPRRAGGRGAGPHPRPRSHRPVAGRLGVRHRRGPC